MASLVRSESLTIWPWSVASFATHRFNSTINPLTLSRSDFISEGEAATRLRFCTAKSDVWVALSFCCRDCAEYAFGKTNSKNPAATINKACRLVLGRGSKSCSVRRHMLNLLHTRSCDAMCSVVPPRKPPPGLNEYR